MVRKNNDDCAQMYSSIHTFCVATTFIDAEKCKADNAIKIRTSLSMFENNCNYIINPKLLELMDKQVLIGTKSNIATLNGIATIQDISKLARDGIVSIIINNCDNTEYKYLISNDVYICQECANGLYTVDSTKCKPGTEN
eukprot:11420_1